MSLFGRIIGDPFADYAGATVTDDVAISDTVIPVDDVSDFDEDAAVNGGVLIVGVEIDSDGLIDQSGATRLPYTTFDEDAGTVTLAAPSPVAIDSGDFVWVLDDVADEPLVDLTVWVEVEGADQDGDPLPALVAHELIGAVTTSDVEGLPVELVVDEDDQLVARPVGGSKAGRGGDGSPVKFYQDEIVVSALGDQTLPLTFRPIVNSEHVYVGTVYQPGSAWTRDGWIITIPDAEKFARVGTRIVCEYAYIDETVRPTVPASLELIGFEAFGTDNTPFTSVPIHAATELGDLLVVAGMSYAPNHAIVNTDGRISHEHSQINTGGIGGVFPNGAYFAGYGIADGSLTDLAIAQSGVADSVVICATFRYTGVLSDTWTGIRDAVADGNLFTIDPGAAPCAIGVFVGQRGTVSNGFHIDIAGPYTTVVDASDSHLGLARAMIAWSDTGGVCISDGLSSPSAWAGMAIGVSDA